MQKGKPGRLKERTQLTVTGGLPTNTILIFNIILTNRLSSSGLLAHRDGDFVYRMTGAAVQRFAETAGRSYLWCPDNAGFRTWISIRSMRGTVKKPKACQRWSVGSAQYVCHRKHLRLGIKRFCSLANRCKGCNNSKLWPASQLRKTVVF
jgi:hypothetical protein